MLKVYRLLRNNREMGPYTLEELLQSNLNSLDLIWVEGKSSCWAYPYEIEALKAHVARPSRPTQIPTPEAAPSRDQHRQQHAAPASPHVFVSMPLPKVPPAPSGGTAAPVSQPLPQAANQDTKLAESVQTTYARSLDEAEEAYTRWVYEQRSKKKKGFRKYALTLSIAAAVITGGLFAGQVFRKQATPSATNPNMPEETPSASWVSGAAVPDTAVTFTANPASDSQIVTKENISSATPKEKSKVHKPAALAPDIQIEESVATTSEPLPQQEETPPVTATTEEETTAASAPEKKKKGFLNGLFKRKGEEGRQTETTPQGEASAGNRKVRRRSDAATGHTTDLAQQIEIRSRATKGGWMLGVMGQKLTLHNHSQETIQAATVEATYFNEENEVLDKKTVVFNNVHPRRQATLPLPDHQLADRVALRLVTATGAAKQP